MSGGNNKYCHATFIDTDGENVIEGTGRTLSTIYYEWAAFI